MRVSMQLQLAGAFGALAVIAVAITSTVLAVVDIDRLDRGRAEQLHGIVQTLARASFPMTEQVLGQVQAMTGSNFVVVGQDRRIRASSLPLSSQQAQTLLQNAVSLDRVGRVSQLPELSLADRSWRVAVAPLRDSSDRLQLIILDPDDQRRQALREAIVWPVAIGIVVGLVAVILAMLLARHVSRRVHDVQAHIAQLGQRDYTQHPPIGPVDELHELHVAVNQLALRLNTLEDEVSRTERMRVLSRLAAGLAHQNRNSIAGARMAVQIHQRRCPASAQDESLSIALRQLELTEHQLRSLVTVAAGELTVDVPGDLRQILEDVNALTQPYRQHLHTQYEFESNIAVSACPVSDADGLRTAVLNLMTNAVEAAGPGGQVSCVAEIQGTEVWIRVRDNGAGPSEDVAPRLFEPFVTSKAEGIGLGLAYAQQRIHQSGGVLSWSRTAGETCFSIRLPLTAPAPTAATELPA